MTTDGERCELCRYFESRRGQCRRHAPVLVERRNYNLTTYIGKMPPKRQLMAKWPPTDVSKWCSAFDKNPAEIEDW